MKQVQGAAPLLGVQHLYLEVNFPCTEDENLSSKLEAKQKQIKDSQTSLTVILTNSKVFWL